MKIEVSFVAKLSENRKKFMFDVIKKAIKQSLEISDIVNTGKIKTHYVKVKELK
jgi:hypothetical protein